MTPFKIISWTIGVWPLQAYNIYSIMRCGLGICGTKIYHLQQSLMVILPSIELYMGCTNAEQNVDCLMLICCGTLGVLKTVWFRIYAGNLTNNYSSALYDYLTVKNAEERAIMRKHAFIGRFLLYLLLSFCYVSCIIYGIIPFLDIDNNNHINETNEEVTLKYPVPSKCCMEYFNAPKKLYKIFCLIETIALILATTANHGNDLLFHNIALHLCGQVKILKINIADFDVTSPQVYDRFNALIQRHSYLIKMARELSDTISFILLMQLLVTSVLLCIIGLQFILALKVNDFVMVSKSTMVYCSFLTQFTLYSFIGDYLKSEMEEVASLFYQTTWYDLPKKLKNRLVFIIMRAKFPVALQAGNFIVINLPTYMNIIKTSVSYLSVLRVMAIMIVCLSLYINHRDDDTLDMLVDHLMLIACGVLTILKVFLIRLHRDDLLKNLCNAMCSSYIVLIPLIAGSFLSFVTQPTSWNVTSNTRSEEETRVVELPQEMICPFNAQIVCFGIYILQTVQLISTSTGNVGTDVFVFAVCMHLCGQLEILASELLRFHEGKENNSWARAKMITLIDRHCLLLNLAKNISDTLDIILIVQLVVHASLICLIGLQLIWSLAMSDFVLVVRTIWVKLCRSEHKRFLAQFI
nr:PREDICTED: uncharacterized protein LOC105672429 [Linepithema humile]